MKELISKIKEALISALPITAIVYIMSLTPLFDFSAVGGISEPEFYDAAAWKKPVLKVEL